jgi:hypothetical protein
MSRMWRGGVRELDKAIVLSLRMVRGLGNDKLAKPSVHSCLVSARQYIQYLEDEIKARDFEKPKVKRGRPPKARASTVPEPTAKVEPKTSRPNPVVPRGESDG